MKKLFFLVGILLLAVSVYGVDIERVDLGNGKFINYVLSTDYTELENFAAREFGVRINIGQTYSWNDNTHNDNLAPQIRSLMRQYTQQGRYPSFAMAIYTDARNDVESIFVNWCYRDPDTGVYIYKTTYWDF